MLCKVKWLSAVRFIQTHKGNASAVLNFWMFNPYPANVENMVAPNNASRWQMGFNSAFNPYSANVENMVSS